MPTLPLPRQSLRRRITLGTMAIFLLGLWGLSFYTSRLLRHDMEHLLGEQQFSTVSIVASNIAQDMALRISALDRVARFVAPTVPRDPGALQAFMQSLPVLQLLFNGGMIVTDINGTVIAEHLADAQPIGAAHRDLDVIAKVLNDGQATIGEPQSGGQAKSSVFGMAVPIRDTNGKVIGALAGIVDMGRPNFIDAFSETPYGNGGGNLLISRRSRLVITATDKKRVMERLPEPGKIPEIDRFLDGYEGASVFTNPHGVEILAADRGVPGTDWIVATVLPTKEAFAPIRLMQQRMLAATLFLTLLTGALMYWLLKRQFAPMQAAAGALKIRARDPDIPLQPLPSGKADEVGQLIDGFNGLLGVLRKREAALHDSEARFRSLLQGIPSVAVQGYTADGTTCYWNLASEALYGYTAAEAIGRNLLDLIIPLEMHAGVRDAMRQMFETGQPIAVSELSLRRKDGSRVTVLSSHAHVQVAGQPPEMFCVDIDLTELKRAEEELRRREYFQRALIDNFPFMVWLKDTESRFLTVNRVFANNFGCPDAESLVGKNDFQITTPDLAERYRADDRAVLTDGISKQVEELIENEGQRRWIETFKSPIRVDGEIVGIVGFARDITERKRIEMELVRSEERLSLMLRGTNEGFWDWDLIGQQLYYSERWWSMLGYAEGELSDDPDLWRRLMHGDDLERVNRFFATALNSDTNAYEVEFRLQHKDGHFVPISSRGYIRRDENGKPIRVSGANIDLSESRRRETELIAARNAADKANGAKSRFLAAASHDLRQPLSALSLYVGVLKSRATPDSVQLVDNIQKCVDSLTELLSDLLDVSKLAAGVVTPTLSDFAIDDLLAGIVTVNSGEAGLKGLRLRRRHSGLIVRSDPTLLRRLIGNLANNAIRYTEKGGVLVACRRHHGRNWVEIWDTGIGFSEEQSEVIFEEFRQLGDNSRSRGSGLGLAIAAKTASLLGLRMRVRSLPGRGSMFAVELIPGRAAIPHASAPRKHLVSRPLRIGLVEDNFHVMRALVVALEHVGHQVQAAPSGRELLAGLGGQAPDIVISDYRLTAGETGYDVIESARAAFGNDLPAIVITGDTEPALIRSMANRGITVHYKPLQMDALLAFITEATERRSS